MKKTILSALFLLLLVGLLPLVCLIPSKSAVSAGLEQAVSAVFEESGEEDSESAGSESQPASEAQSESEGQSEPGTPSEGQILLEDADTGTLLTLAPAEYLVGAVASEMPATWPDQALMAQMIASHSFVLYQKEHCADPNAGWVSVAPARMEGYLTPEVRTARWGGSAAEWEQKLQALATEGESVLLTYDGSPAAACYHAISQGHTEASQNVWNEALPYLQGVDSPLDKTADGYAQSVEYTKEQMADALAANLGLAPEGDPVGWFGATEWYDTGYVRSIEICGQRIAGVKLRKALGLRSNCFSVSYSDGRFFISTHGYGHGVGLSQWGARLMAEQGADWREILAHYFPGTEITGG